MNAPQLIAQKAARQLSRWRVGGQSGPRHATRRVAGALRDDRGSGSVLALAVVAATLVVTALLMTLGAAFTVKHQVQGAADAAALAAADVSAGFVGGYPCEAAKRVAELNGAGLADCELAGVTAAVRVQRSFMGIIVAVSARAGPGPQEAAGPAP